MHVKEYTIIHNTSTTHMHTLHIYTHHTHTLLLTNSCLFQLSVFVLFWFQIFSGFSGSLMIDSLYLTMQHVAFVALPPLINGVFDKDVSAEMLLANPVLYKPCQRSEVGFFDD